MRFDRLIILMLSIVFSCESPNSKPEVTQTIATDFEEEKEVSARLKEGFEFKLWAPGRLSSNVVSMSIDNQGVVYVSETSRRKSSDIDIREHLDWEAEDLGLQTLEDTRQFHLQKLATELSTENSWQEDFNGDSIHDYRDLEVQSEYIRRIWDSDDDGRADASALFAEGFNSLLTGVAAGVISHNGEVFLTAAPDVWRLKDKDGDGDADERTSISHGYGIHIGYAGHDMSGLTIGPDGKIYWSIGDLGVNVVDANGKRWAYPNQGAVMRANPDGSDFEVFAHGLRNPQELAFNAYGDLFSVDNDGDHAGEHERYVHIIEGSDSGWRTNWQYGKYRDEKESYKIWTDERLHVPYFEGQAAYILPPLALAPNGPAGLVYNPGTGLGSEWKDYFFATYFTGSSANSSVQAFRMKTNGATYALDTAEIIVGGIVPTGIDFGPDGALYINDWKDGYDKKPTGRIWKLDLQSSDIQGLRLETQAILKAGMKDRSNETLDQLLVHQDMRVRMEAQFELVKRNATDVLQNRALKSDNQLGRLHAIWGLGQLARQGDFELNEIMSLLEDKDQAIRAQVAKILGEAKFMSAYDQLLGLLADQSLRVQFFAVEALGKLANPRAFEALVQLLEKNGDHDLHLRHAIILALSRIGNENTLAALAEHPSIQVRLGAIVALRRLKSVTVSQFLQEKHPWVLAEAARAIHDDFSIPAALPALANVLQDASVMDTAFILRAINANLRLGEAKNAKILANFAARTDVPDYFRQEALFALSYWSNPPVLDRVDNRYRVLPDRTVADVADALQEHYLKLLNNNTEQIRLATAYMLGQLKMQVAKPKLTEIFRNRRATQALRLTALQALAKMELEEIGTLLEEGLSDKNQLIREAAQTLLGIIDLPANTVVNLLTKVLDENSIAEKQRALAGLSLLSSNDAEILLMQWFRKLERGEVPKKIALDVLMAAQNSPSEILQKAALEYEQGLESLAVLEQYESSLAGGNAEKGRALFYENNAAQCIRCHIIGERGGEAGPNLTAIAAQLSSRELLQSMIDPNERIAPGYGTVILSLKNGEELSGIILEETANFFRIQNAKDTNRTILKSDITESEKLPSGMFNMAEVLSRSELRDLLAFLETLKGETN